MKYFWAIWSLTDSKESLLGGEDGWSKQAGMMVVRREGKKLEEKQKHRKGQRGNNAMQRRMLRNVTDCCAHWNLCIRMVFSSSFSFQNNCETVNEDKKFGFSGNYRRMRTNYTVWENYWIGQLMIFFFSGGPKNFLLPAQYKLFNFFASILAWEKMNLQYKFYLLSFWRSERSSYHANQFIGVEKEIILDTEKDFFFTVELPHDTMRWWFTTFSSISKRNVANFYLSRWSQKMLVWARETWSHVLIIFLTANFQRIRVLEGAAHRPYGL